MHASYFPTSTDISSVKHLSRTSIIPPHPHIRCSPAVIKSPHRTDHNPTIKTPPRPHKAQNAGRAPRVECADCARACRKFQTGFTGWTGFECGFVTSCPSCSSCQLYLLPMSILESADRQAPPRTKSLINSNLL